MKIGVIIPTLNEEAFIGCTLEKLQERGEAELVVVVDCGSEDKTTNIVHMKGENVIGGNHLNCRSAALNEGAMWILHHNPKIDVLWFLHADTIPPKDWDQTIKTVLADPCVIAGAFDFQWDLDGIPWKSRLLLHIISLNNRMRFRITRSYFGDQALFVRSNAFLTIGGFPDTNLMEDVIICRRLKQLGNLRLVKKYIITSPRRFLYHGILKQTTIDLTLLTAERLGLKLTQLYPQYNREKG